MIQSGLCFHLMIGLVLDLTTSQDLVEVVHLLMCTIVMEHVSTMLMLMAFVMSWR